MVRIARTTSRSRNARSAPELHPEKIAVPNGWALPAALVATRTLARRQRIERCYPDLESKIVPRRRRKNAGKVCDAAISVWVDNAASSARETKCHREDLNLCQRASQSRVPSLERGQVNRRSDSNRRPTWYDNRRETARSPGKEVATEQDALPLSYFCSSQWRELNPSFVRA
jgi:hypothetical protein